MQSFWLPKLQVHSRHTLPRVQLGGLFPGSPNQSVLVIFPASCASDWLAQVQIYAAIGPACQARLRG